MSTPLALVVSAHTIEFVYMAAALLFIFGLKRLSGVRTARSGNAFATLGMALAVGGTLFLLGEVSLFVLVGGLAVGTILGILLATRVQMTEMPELVAFFNGLGGAASACVALSEVARYVGLGGGTTLATGGSLEFANAILVSILIGSVTLSGSFVAYGKLSGKIKDNRLGPIGSQGVNMLLALVVLAFGIWAGYSADGGLGFFAAFALLTLASLVLGIGLTVPIGGADMPVVISLLNSYSGLAACATGFVLENNLLITAGSLVGASGLILTQIMCKAMNRSLTNVLFATFGEESSTAGKNDEYTSVKAATAEDAAPILDVATSVVFVPGYGMAVAQAQHKVRELASLLEAKGCKVSYGIHPVAGRMPGHMNVLLAEADVPYEQLFDLDQINGEFQNTDVAIVVGANDVCNPAANDDPKSPIAGMPVLKVWEAQTVFVVKRSLSPGYAGIKNDLFEADNTLMCFGDGKQFLEDLIAELKDL